MRGLLLGLAFSTVACSDGSPAIDAGVSSDLAVIPAGPAAALWSGKSQTLLDTTTDDWVILNPTSNTPGELTAVSLADGSQQTIDPMYAQHSTLGQVVLSWSNQDVDQVGTLTLWSAAGGAHPVALSSPGHVGAAAPDGSVVLWADHAAKGAMDLLLSAADGSRVRATTLGQVAYDPVDCPLAATFAGGRFFVSTCTPSTDGGVTTATVSFIEPATGAATLLATGVVPGALVVSTAGDRVLTVDPTNNATVTLVGGNAIPVVTGMNLVTGFFSDGADAVIYLATDGSLQRATLDSMPATSALVPPQGSLTLQSVSPRARHLLYSTTVDLITNSADLSLLALDGASAPLHLADAGAVTGGVYGDAWTRDGAWALYLTDLQPDGSGTLHAQPTAGGAETVAVGAVYDVYAMSGSTIAFNDRLAGNRADVEVLDLSGGDLPTLVAPQAELDIQVSASGNYLLYNLFAVKGQEASYAFKLP